MTFTYKNHSFNFTRYPKSDSATLQPWSSADEHLLKVLDDFDITTKPIIIYNDRFGFLTSLLHDAQPFTIIDYKSQEKACHHNLTANSLNMNNFKTLNSLSILPSSPHLGIIKIPKSLALFQLYLNQLCEKLDDSGVVICSFMTRHFSDNIIRIANQYFELVEQSRAWKKSRVLILKGKRPYKKSTVLEEIHLEKNKMFYQYSGVFSSGKIDYATQFLLDHLELKENENIVLDLASGSGIIASTIQQKRPEAEIHLLDDSLLAIESSKLNLKPQNTFFHLDDTLEKFDKESFDLVVTNPPFHFEYETNIEVSLNLFKQVSRCLKPNGRFFIVANRHLNYKTHLTKWFGSINISAENEKFVVYECFIV